MRYCDQEYDKHYQSLSEADKNTVQTIDVMLRHCRMGGLSLVLFTPGKAPVPDVGLAMNASKAFQWVYERLADDLRSRATFDRQPLPEGDVHPLAYCIAHNLLLMALQLPDEVQEQGGSTAEERVMGALQALRPNVPL